MNNGVNNTNQANSGDGSALAPMAGVKIAPAMDQPVNASSTATATSAPQPSSVLQPQQPAITQPVVTQTAPVVQTPTQTQTQAPSIQETIESRLSDGLPTIQQQAPAQPEPEPEPQQTPPAPETTPTPQKKLNISVILIVLLVALGGYTFYSTNNYQNQINQIRYNCTPVNSSEEIELDVNSTLVKDLYSKVETNIREDIANPEFNDSMRLYLAYRQIKDKDKYDSNCNLFSNTSMEPYTCKVSTEFIPKAFKAETLQLEIKKLFGDDTNIPLTNIQLGNSCVIGYQYIKDRGENGEFVEGYCNQKTATSYKVTKTITKAVSTNNTIIITEEVKYHENEKMELPSSLVSGTYNYTFRLDKNYNYVLVSKTYVNKY